MKFGEAMTLASPMLLGLASDIEGRTSNGAAIGMARMQANQQNAERKEAVSKLLGEMGLGSQKAALIDTLPVEMQQRVLLDEFSQREALRRSQAAAGASAARKSAEQAEFARMWGAVNGSGSAPAQAAPAVDEASGLPLSQPVSPMGQPGGAMPTGQPAQQPRSEYDHYQNVYGKALAMPPSPMRDKILAEAKKHIDFHEPEKRESFVAADGYRYYTDGSRVFPKVTAPENTDTTAREQKIASLMEIHGISEQDASLIADGIVVTSRDPITGEAQIVNKFDHFGQPATPAPALELPEVDGGTSALPSVDYGAALGATGDLKNLVNIAGDYLTGTRVFEDVGKARTGLNNLRTRTLTTLATAGVAGRPSNYVMEMFNQNVVQPGILSGSTGARDTAQQTQSFIDAMISENRAVLQSRTSPQMKAQANRNIEALKGLSKDYEKVLESWNKGSTTGTGIQWSIIE